jgi:hypothetical protein
VTVSENRTVRISSQVSLSSEVLRSSGPFTNHGPIPPKAEEETTYTVFFNVGNTQGDMSEAKVTARLGSGVSWLGPASDSSENVTYDPDSNLLTWDIGALSSGAGFSSSARELVFQISLTPSISQIGTVPTLVSNILFSGREVATGLATTVNNPSLSTRLFNDPTFIQGDDVVTQ